MTEFIVFFALGAGTGALVAGSVYAVGAAILFRIDEIILVEVTHDKNND